jgi:predicted ester cyclase
MSTSTTLDMAERNRETVERFLAGTHAPDLSALSVIDETVDESIRGYGFPGGLDPVDRESYKQFFRVFRGAFGNMAFKIHSLIADAQHVAARFEVSVDHVAPFAGIAPDGRRVVFEGMALYGMKDGRIASTWLQIDQLSLLQQIGALPLAQTA